MKFFIRGPLEIEFERDRTSSFGATPSNMYKHTHTHTHTHRSSERQTQRERERERESERDRESERERERDFLKNSFSELNSNKESKSV